MPLNLLQIVNRVQGELGLAQSASVISNTDATTVQLFNLANRAIDDLRREHTWTVLQTEFNLIVNPPTITTGNTTLNSPVITNIPNTTGLLAQYFTVASNSVPPAARIKSVDSATQVTMTMAATGTTTGVRIVFSQDTYSLPLDIDWYQNYTFWDRTNHWRLFGPDSPQTDQTLRSGIVPTTPRRHFRQIGPFANRFRLWPPPAELVNPIQLTFEYLSLNAVIAGASAGDFSSDFGPDFFPSASYARFFTSDTDQPLLDEQAVILGMKWMFWEIKGFNFATMQQRWVDYVQRLKARDGAAPTLALARRPTSVLISPSNVQDGSYPQGVSTSAGL